MLQQKHKFLLSLIQESLSTSTKTRQDYQKYAIYNLEQTSIPSSLSQSVNDCTGCQKYPDLANDLKEILS